MPASEQPDGPPLTKVYSQDTLLTLPRHPAPKVDSQLMHDLGEEMTQVIVDSAEQFEDQGAHQENVIARFKELEIEYREKFAG